MEGKIGCAAALAVALAVVAWLAAILVMPHFPMAGYDAAKLQTASKSVADELQFHFSNSTDSILVPRKDDGLDVFLKKRSFESVPFPDRPDAVLAVANSWCSQISSGLLPSVKFRDIETGEVFSSTSCDLSNTEPSREGSYGGTVHNSTANTDAEFYATCMDPDTNGDFTGCVRVEPPLYGTGRITGSITKKGVEFRLNQPSNNIKFNGGFSADILTGKYSVNNNSEQGSFSLHKFGNYRARTLNFSFETCQ